MKACLEYLWYILKHKYYVYVECFILASYSPLRDFLPLVWRGVIHDWSKFTPREFFPYMTHFYLKKKTKGGFQKAWLNHIHKNDHHWNHWVSYGVDGPQALQMPNRALLEMVADWHGMGHTLSRKETTRDWYEKRKETFLLHPETRKELERLLQEDPGPSYQEVT